jgi:adenylate kinase
MTLRVLLIAPPGAGKGTQGTIIAEHFGVPHIATGDLLRDHVARQTPLGRTVAKYLDQGDLVPDDVVLDMVRDAIIAARESGGGYVLDGIPRTIDQAFTLYQLAKELDMVANVALHLEVGDAEVTRRLLARAAIDGRSDDNADVIAKRLALYHEVTSPILSWYDHRGILIDVDSDRPVAAVTHDILGALESMKATMDVTSEAAADR